MLPLKSAVHVYCRFRSDDQLYDIEVSHSEREHASQFPISFNNERQQVSIFPSEMEPYAIQFQFTGILPPSVTQEQAFQMIAKENIALVLNGFNCSIIAYVIFLYS